MKTKKQLDAMIDLNLRDYNSNKNKASSKELEEIRKSIELLRQCKLVLDSGLSESKLKLQLEDVGKHYETALKSWDDYYQQNKELFERLPKPVVSTKRNKYLLSRFPIESYKQQIEILSYLLK